MSAYAFIALVIAITICVIALVWIVLVVIDDWAECECDDGCEYCADDCRDPRGDL